METPDNTEYAALERRSKELQKELGLDKPLDKLGLMRAEVRSLEVLKELRERLPHLESSRSYGKSARRRLAVRPSSDAAPSEDTTLGF